MAECCPHLHTQQPLFCARTGFQINQKLWVWLAIDWIEFANPLTSVSVRKVHASTSAPALPLACFGKLPSNIKERA